MRNTIFLLVHRSLYTLNQRMIEMKNYIMWLNVAVEKGEWIKLDELDDFDVDLKCLFWKDFLFKFAFFGFEKYFKLLK